MESATRGGEERMLATAFILLVLAAHVYAIFARVDVYPLTDYHLFAEPVTVDSLAVYRPAAVSPSGELVFLTESPVVYEHQNAFGTWVHDFVAEQHGRFFDPKQSRWVARSSAEETLERLSRSDSFDFPVDWLLLVETKAATRDGYWQTLAWKHRTVLTLHP